MMTALGSLFLLVLALVLAVLLIIFVGVPLLKGIGGAVTAIFAGIGWFIRHVAGFVVGMVRDAVRLVGAAIAMVLFVPLVALSVVVGRWSASSHFAAASAREVKVFAACLYRIVLQRPLRLLLLDGLLEGVEQRMPEAVAAVPGADAPSRRSGVFEGYRIVGSLRPGGSGAKLYVAEPEDALRSRRPELPEQVVIKSFAIVDGSSLPQIVRESRALDAARQLGLILDHGLDEARFFYVMPYHPGEPLGTVVRQLHGESPERGLDARGIRTVTSYSVDLVETLAAYHRGGLWHKDVKPDNIIVHAGRAHVVDLGLVTPLRSAMTLTTHGTEYFRDPEMVRMALRGVKVHQVDGAKFDIYGAGAVLYYALEGTFPAHGALSAFSRRSPESLRWIVRRAMADYAKRYDSAETMLADLRHVLAAADPFEVRPAELPSLGGYADADAPAAPRHHARPGSATPVAWTPRPPAGPGPVWGPAAPATVAAIAGTLAAPGGRAPIRVVNWWTGAYQVGGAPVRGFGEAPQQGSGRRPTAQDQIVAARHRAAELRRRTRAHVASRVHRPATPGAAVAVIVLLVIAAIAALTLLAAGLLGSRTVVAQRGFGELADGMQVAVTVPSLPQFVVTDASGRSVRVGPPAPLPPVAPVAPVADTAATQAGAAAPALAGCEDLRIVVVNTHADPAAPAVMRQVEARIAEQESRGYRVCTLDTAAIAELAGLLPQFARGSEVADVRIEELLESRGLFGVLWITSPKERGGQPEATLIRSTREGAELRSGPCPE